MGVEGEDGARGSGGAKRGRVGGRGAEEEGREGEAAAATREATRMTVRARGRMPVMADSESGERRETSECTDGECARETGRGVCRCVSNRLRKRGHAVWDGR